jgi:hypothetical protein
MAVVSELGLGFRQEKRPREGPWHATSNGLIWVRSVSGRGDYYEFGGHDAGKMAR